MKTLFAIIYNLFVCLFVGTLMSVLGVPPVAAYVVAMTLFCVGLIPRAPMTGVLRDEVLITIFSSDIQSNIFPDNSFYKQSRVDDGVAITATSVQIPQAGQRATVVKNPTDFPLPVSQRTDDKKSYDVDLYATLPIHVQDVNEATVSYDKRADILRDHISELVTRIASEMAYNWSATLSSNIKRTNGTANTGSTITGMTGTRKEIIDADMVDMATLFDRMDIPVNGRKVLFTADMLAEVKKIDKYIDYDKTGLVGQVSKGAIGMIRGFEVYMRSNTIVYNSSGVKKSVGSSVVSSDNQAAIFWHPSYVRCAEGVVDVFAEYKKPGYLGSIFNAAVRAGGCIGRSDEKGVGLLVQQA